MTATPCATVMHCLTITALRWKSRITQGQADEADRVIFAELVACQRGLRQQALIGARDRKSIPITIKNL
jgi:hypothetical protein